MSLTLVNHLWFLLLQIKLKMAILALTELDCIQMDWVQNGNQFFGKDEGKL